MDEHDQMQEGGGPAGILVPQWVLYAVSGAISLFGLGGVGWCSWVTVTLLEISGRDELVVSNGQRISALERSHESIFAQLQVLSATRFTAEQGRQLTQGLETRLDRLELKIDSTNKDLGELRREFDRTFPKPDRTSSGT